MIEVAVTIDFGSEDRQPIDTIVIVPDRSTVFEALLKAVPVASSARYGMDHFVEEIGGIRNDFAADRGWCFEVNGRESGVPAERYLVKNGDWIKWRYRTAGSE